MSLLKNLGLVDDDDKKPTKVTKKPATQVTIPAPW